MNSQSLSDSLKETVKRAIGACETHGTAALVWADFTDQLRECETEQARVCLCNRWIRMFKQMKEVA